MVVLSWVDEEHLRNRGARREMLMVDRLKPKKEQERAHRCDSIGRTAMHGRRSYNPVRNHPLPRRLADPSSLC